MNDTSLKSPLVILRRIYLDITQKNHCAAKLIEYFKHWREWKQAHHRTEWIYMPLKRIYEDLMEEHSLHVIRKAIALLEELGLIERRHNPSNGQDKTWQYRLDVGRLQELLEPEHRESETESLMCENEHSENNVEQQQQLPNIDSLDTNFIPTLKVGEEKNCSEKALILLDKYSERLKQHGIYVLIWPQTSEHPIRNPAMLPILSAVRKVPKKAEQAITAFLRWIRTAKNVEDRYKVLESAILGGWQ